MTQRTIPADISISILKYLADAKRAAASRPERKVAGLNDIEWNIEMAEKMLLGYLVHDVSVETMPAPKPDDAT